GLLKFLSITTNWDVVTVATAAVANDLFLSIATMELRKEGESPHRESVSMVIQLPQSSDPVCFLYPVQCDRVNDYEIGSSVLQGKRGAVEAELELNERFLSTISFPVSRGPCNRLVSEDSDLHVRNCGNFMTAGGCSATEKVAQQEALGFPIPVTNVDKESSESPLSEDLTRTTMGGKQGLDAS
ncbi:hypothetical protein FOZ62_004171, partial [Perkinsus olseni]